MEKFGLSKNYHYLNNVRGKVLREEREGRTYVNIFKYSYNHKTYVKI